MAFWFRQKSYGYGATPASWQGWVATLVFLVVVLGLIWFMVIANAIAGSLTGLNIVLFIVAVVIVSLAFVWLCWKKTAGGWHWRWGNPPA